MKVETETLTLRQRIPGLWSRFTGGRSSAKAGPRVVLASMYENPATMYAYAGLLPSLAGSFDAKAAAYSFSPHSPALAATYRGLGIPCVLGIKQCRKFRSEARRWAEGVFSKNPTKQELADLSLDGFTIGPLFCDTFQRVHGAGEIVAKDPHLLQIAIEAAEIYFAAKEYLDANDVVAVFPDHLVYNASGILAQLAWERGIPVLFCRFADPFLIYCIPPKRPEEPRMQVAYQHTFDRYPDIFASLDNQDARLSKARAALADHLQGRKKDLILGANSAYAAHTTNETILPPATRPRVLVMLHDFCDAPHVYGRFLFPDYFDWIHHLLRKAAETPYEWLIKPHPNLQDRSRRHMVETNMAVLTDLQKRYPFATFLEPSASNLQLIDEGVRALFTVHGTSGHEFAYFGIPVVNAGPNPHIRYGFNRHPATIDEFDELIAAAGELTATVERRDIEEFYYMYYLSLNDRFGADFELFSASKDEQPRLPSQFKMKDFQQWKQEHLAGILPRIESYVERVIKPQIERHNAA